MARHNPYTVKMEVVRGCTRRCPFCALSSIEWAEDPWQFMELDLFKQVVDDLAKWLPKHRMEFAERGEPSFHPKLPEMIAYAREHLPRAQLTLTSNGDMVKKRPGEKFKKWLTGLFEAGLNICMLDCYELERYELMKQLLPEADDFFEDGVHPYGYHGPKHKQIILVNATAGMSNIIRWYQNQGGNVDSEQAREAGFEIPVIQEPLQKMCVRPFRELVIHYDGSVPICCNDWREESPAGKFPDTSLEKLWNKGLDPYRKLLLKKDRGSIEACHNCSERAGFRVGLEMNWFAK